MTRFGLFLLIITEYMRNASSCINFIVFQSRSVEFVSRADFVIKSFVKDREGGTVAL